MDQTKIRTVGNAEATHAYRHDMNIYMSVNVGAVLKHSENRLNTSHLYPALKKLVLENPVLSNLIRYEPSTDTHDLVMAKQVDLAKNVVWKSAADSANLEYLIREQVSQQFPDTDSIPPWRLWITPEQEGTKLNFFFHHTLFDGTSGRLFLTGLRDKLNDVNLPSDTNYFVNVLESSKLNPPVEELVENTGPIAQVTDDTETWTGDPVIDTFSPGPNCKPLLTQCLYYNIGGDEIKLLVQKCKHFNTSITALLTTLALHSLNETLKNNGLTYAILKGTVPRNLRPLIKRFGPDSMGSLVSSINVTYNSCTDNSSSIWAEAASIRSQIQASLDSGIEDIVFDPPPVPNFMRTKYEKRVGEARSHALEMSTILINEAPPSSDQKTWYLEDLEFLQGVSSEGPPITCSAISYKGGPLKVSFVWGSEFVADTIIQDMVNKFALCIEQLLQE